MESVNFNYYSYIDMTIEENKQSRTLVNLIGIPSMLFVIWQGGYLYVGFFTVIILLGAIELSNLAQNPHFHENFTKIQISPHFSSNFQILFKIHNFTKFWVQNIQKSRHFHSEYQILFKIHIFTKF